MLLRQLQRVNQVGFQMDHDVKVWYVGRQKKIEMVVDGIGLKGLFGERFRYAW